MTKKNISALQLSLLLSFADVFEMVMSRRLLNLRIKRNISNDSQHGHPEDDHK